MTKQIRFVAALAVLAIWSTITLAGNPAAPFEDKTRAFALPTLIQNPKGEIVLSWTEKDQKGVVYFYFSVSNDKGKTFSDKKLIYASAGLGNGRLMRPKLLFKKDGTIVAVFSHRLGDVPTPKPAPATHEENHGEAHSHGKPASQTPPASGRPKRDLQIQYSYSTDRGTTWSTPVSVDSDPTKGVRGFFDAVVMSNDEIAVAYLKDVAGSTKHEERDLRLAVTKNGTFQPEKLIDPVVCDCCNISLLVDSKGTLNIYYRDNNENIRDIAKMTSADNALTFSKPQILHNDNWQINGCPHSGPTSSVFGESSLISWFSGTASNTSGIRVVTNEGKRLFVLDNPSAKNAYLFPAFRATMLVWEQVKEKSEEGVTSIVIRKMMVNGTSETKWVENSENGTNATGLVIDNQVIVAYEIKQPNNLNAMKISVVNL
jgi:BNR repeat-like domain